MADDTYALIEDLEHRWRDALCAKDVETLKELIHPNFVLIATRGNEPFVINRDEWLEAIQKREVVTVNFRIRDAAAFPEMMVGTIEARWRVVYLGREIDDCVLLTDVWVCENGRWQAVRRHSTPLPSGLCGA